MEDKGMAVISISGRPDNKVPAGSFCTVTYTFTAGHPIDDTGYVKVVFRYAGDFGTPQFVHPADPNYCSVKTDGDCRIEARWDAKGHTRPWGKSLYLKVMGGYLDKGETITVVFGDTGLGSPGWRIQTFRERTFAFRTFVDPYATYQFKELEHSPEIDIIPGKPVKAVCIAPSQVVAESTFPVWLRLEDHWGNAVGSAREYQVKAVAKTGAVTTVVTDPETGLSAESNPYRVVGRRPELGQWWADFHGQSEETIGSNTIEEYFDYAKRCAKLDIAAHQGNDFQITDKFWKHINAVTAEYNEPGSFITFPGYEWSGNTPLGGDRNIYFRREGYDISRSSHDLLPDGESTYPDSPTATGLFRRLEPESSFVFAHVGGRYADVSMHRENVEVAMEIHSAWGTFEWLVQDALERGYRVGICANSDGHKGRPGASYPGANKFGSYGGLTCVLAETLDRDSIFSALHARHFFATTGHRPLFSVTVTSGSGKAVMGDTLDVVGQEVSLAIEYHGTAAVEFLEIHIGREVVETVYPCSEKEAGNRIKVSWNGAERRGRDRMVTWDGNLAVAGNNILEVTPVNFWNADKQPKTTGRHNVVWNSITTGGVSGIILDLEARDSGKISVHTKQADLHCSIAELGLVPKSVDAGGLGKQLSLYRLSGNAYKTREFTVFRNIMIPVEADESPLFVKVMQEDGHITWSSPVFIREKADKQIRNSD